VIDGVKVDVGVDDGGMKVKVGVSVDGGGAVAVFVSVG